MKSNYTKSSDARTCVVDGGREKNHYGVSAHHFQPCWNEVNVARVRRVVRGGEEIAKRKRL